MGPRPSSVSTQVQPFLHYWGFQSKPTNWFTIHWNERKPFWKKKTKKKTLHSNGILQVGEHVSFHFTEVGTCARTKVTKDAIWYCSATPPPSSPSNCMLSAFMWALISTKLSCDHLLGNVFYEMQLLFNLGTVLILSSQKPFKTIPPHPSSQ